MPNWMPWMQGCMLAFLMLLWTAPARAAAPESPPTVSPDIEAQAQALARANASVVGGRAVAVEDARSSDSLGRERNGSGVVIDNDGLVVTIGYLILEADHVELVLEHDRVVPARVVAYDLASGFGLLQALVPL